MNTITKTTEITIDSKPVRRSSAKPVYCISDGEIYASVTDAAIAVDSHVSLISAACLGKIKTAKDKQWCFVKDMKDRILDISNATKEYLADAKAYRAIEAERKAKEEHEANIKRMEERINSRAAQIAKLEEELEVEYQMYEAMKAEYTAA